MQEFIDGLNTRFDIAFKTDTDREFYVSLYYYFEYILTTPTLKEIFARSEHEYHQAFGEIWKERKKYTEEELDIKSAEVSKLERFNLYALGCNIEAHIYLPIDDYRNERDPKDRRDPVGVILMRGLNYAIRLGKWNEKNLRSYYRWFDGKRNEYEVELRRFHLMFLEELGKVKEPIQEKVNKKIKVFLDENKGIYRQTETGMLSYKIKVPSKRFHIVNYIFGKEKVKTSILATATRQTEELVRKEIDRTNELFCKNLKVGSALILKIGTGGYSLNTEEFNIVKN